MTTIERVRSLRPHFDEVVVHAGELLAVEGALCHQLLVVVEGRLETCRGGVRGELVAGQGFGWAAMRDRGVNEADVRAVTDARLLVMSHAQFRAAEPLPPRSRFGFWAFRRLEIGFAGGAQLDGSRRQRGSWPRAAGTGRTRAS
jgi:CRP-like cAMP-binding protein